MASFERAVTWIINHEIGDASGWTRDPEDPGKATRWGLSSRANPDLDLETLTRERAYAVYRERYWAKIKGDALPEALGLVMMDHAVLQGVSSAVRSLQGILAVPMDGKLGPRTLAAVDTRAPGPLAKELIGLRKRQLVENGNRRYLAGWLGRLVDLALEV